MPAELLDDGKDLSPAPYGGDQPGEIYVTDEDRKDLVGRGKTSSRRAGSIHIGGLR